MQVLELPSLGGPWSVVNFGGFLPLRCRQARSYSVPANTRSKNGFVFRSSSPRGWQHAHKMTFKAAHRPHGLMKLVEMSKQGRHKEVIRQWEQTARKSALDDAKSSSPSLETQDPVAENFHPGHGRLERSETTKSSGFPNISFDIGMVVIHSYISITNYSTAFKLYLDLLQHICTDWPAQKRLSATKQFLRKLAASGHRLSEFPSFPKFLEDIRPHMMAQDAALHDPLFEPALDILLQNGDLDTSGLILDEMIFYSVPLREDQLITYTTLTADKLARASSTSGASSASSDSVNAHTSSHPLQGLEDHEAIKRAFLVISCHPQYDTLTDLGISLLPQPYSKRLQKAKSDLFELSGRSL